MKYIIGLDIGIGSVGWAVIRDDDKKRIENYGVRIFESGESNNGKDRASQKRRGLRSTRRLVRRRSHRKNRLKAHLQHIGLVTTNDVNLYFEQGHNDILTTRVRGIDQRLTPCEIAASLINICNRRGYKDFYEVNVETLSDAEKKEYESERQGAALINRLMASNKYRTVAEMYQNDSEFDSDNGVFRKFRNSKFNEATNLASRNMLIDEVLIILNKQKEYYPCLTDENINISKDIIFNQRDFEDGPGNANDKFRRYKGFLDSIGNCQFYKDEKRGQRYTIIADIYALTNVLSQYKYYDAEGNFSLPAKLSQSLITYTLKNGRIDKKEIKQIAGEYGIKVNMVESEKGDSISNCIKYLKVAKKIFEDNGFDYKKLAFDNYLDIENNLINRVGVVLSTYQTPSRRRTELNKIEEIKNNYALIDALLLKKFSGTSKVSVRYMIDSISAFFSGDIYGKFQADLIKSLEKKETSEKTLHFKLPSFEEEKNTFEFYKNPVVCRSINETRKIINNIIDLYGSPYAVNIEVASELNKCFEDRLSDIKNQKKNEKETNNARIEISKLMNIEESEISSVMIEKYKLGEIQGWKCLYSGKDIDKKDCLSKNNRSYEIDHIIPFSLILDNTLSNKALVLASENQYKKQRCPLMYLSDDKAKEFTARVNELWQKKKINEKKRSYLLLPSLSEADMLDEWKSRNINDTRYIAKYLVNYLKNNLQFGSYSHEGLYRDCVYAVKSSITSRMRRQWLNSKTWGIYDKSELKQITYLDHAVDAVVIANCLPAYVEIASENIKLRNMFKKAGNVITPEYTNSMENCIETMFKFYHLRRSVVEPLLKYKKKTPCLIDNLRDEVDKRFVDCDLFRRWGNECAEAEKRKAIEYTDEEIEKLYSENMKSFYFDDPPFAQQLRMPLVSCKLDKKYAGEITTSNPVSMIEIDGKMYQKSRKDVTAIKAKDIDSIYSSDNDLINTLKNLLKDAKDTTTVGDILKADNKPFFITEAGTRINSVTVLFAYKSPYLKKEICEGNYTYYDDKSYYCVEIYKDIDGLLDMQGIKYSYLKKLNSKLYLNKNYIRPSNYVTHVMYLFTNDYIVLRNKKGNIKFKGYYKSVFNINENELRYIKYNTPCNNKKRFSVSKNDSVVKYNVDILGRIGGEIKCGEPLLSIEESE